MPTNLSTVGPGKDYSTLQGWIEDKLGSSDNEDAECYAGDLGDAYFSGWGSPESSIYVVPGNQHNGTDAGTTGIAHAGFITWQVEAGSNILRFRGLRLSGLFTISNIAAGSHEFHLDDMLMVFTGDASGALVHYEADDAFGFCGIGFILRNCILLVKPTSGSFDAGISFNGGGGFGDGVFGQIAAYNNTVIRSAGTLRHCFDFDAPGGDVQVSAANNIGLGASLQDYRGVGADFTGSSHNMSSDATGDDWGATGAKINQVAALVVVNPSTDPTLLETSPAKDVGRTITPADAQGGDFSDDAIGQTRPQGPAWDMGALELFQEVVGRFRRSRILKFWHNH